MSYRAPALVLAACLFLEGCAAQPNGQPGSENATATTLEGTGIGAVAGGVFGYLLGGKEGALIGTAAGAALGTAAGGYVAAEKAKYTSIDQRIAGEQQLAEQAIATANAQTAASRAQKRAIDRQLAALEASRSNSQAKIDQANALYGSLQTQNTQLTHEQAQMQASIDHQQAMISATEQDVAQNPDPQKEQAIAQWKAQIPHMQTALAAMTTQINEVSAEETKVASVTGCCNS